MSDAVRSSSLLITCALADASAKSAGGAGAQGEVERYKTRAIPRHQRTLVSRFRKAVRL